VLNKGAVPEPALIRDRMRKGWTEEQARTLPVGTLLRPRGGGARRKHGHYAHKVNGKSRPSPTHHSYNGMIQRCYNETHESYSKYGERGIEVCDRWRFGEDGKTGFECFLADMDVRPAVEFTLERKEGDKNYEKDNCKWASLQEQNNNKSDTRFVTIDEERMSFCTALDKFDRRPHYHVILRRLNKGWAAKDAFTYPIKTKKKRATR